MELNVGQNLFEAIQAVTGHTSLESDMQQILSAVEKDNSLKNIDALHGVRPSLLDNVKEIAFGDGSAQERMREIKVLFSNEA